MAGTIVGNPIQLNDNSVTANNNFVWVADNIGGVKLSRGNAGATTQDIIAVDVFGNVSMGINGVVWGGPVSGTVNAIILTPVPILTYTAGQTFKFLSTGANTGAATVNISGLGVKNITKNGATALATGDIPALAIVYITYDGTQFQLLTGYAANAGVATTATAAANGAKAYGLINGTTSVVLKSFNVASSSRVGAGIYNVVLSPALADTSYIVMVSSQNTGNVLLGYAAFSSPSQIYITFQTVAGVLTDTTFSIVVFD